ncbi:MAG TPA: TonB-dependent receptor plug domain-containing protein, partial [Lacunisphaera sp.]
MTFPALLRRLAGVLLLFICLPAFGADEPARKDFRLPAGDAAVTLKKFVEQSGAQVVYLVDSVRGVTTKAVRGKLASREALRRMLAGTALTALEDTRTGALTISRGEPPAIRKPASPPAAAPPSGADEVLTLSPFEVNASRDEGYGALQSNTLTSFRMDLLKMPATAQVFTQSFMDDIAATSIENMLVDYSGTVGYNPNNAAAALDMTGDRNGAQGLGIRGLQASGVKRDGFLGMKNNSRTTTGNTDNFSVERVELIEGPQSLLYGAVGGGGVINAVSKRANFRARQGLIRFAIDNHGDKRTTFDYARGHDRFAVRIAGVHGKGATERFNLSNQHDFEGIYAQVAYRVTPKITLRVLGERNSTLAVFNNDPNLDAFLPADDARRGQNSRYLVLTHQLDGVATVIDGGLDYANFSSLSGWWQSEKIKNDYVSAVLEAELGAGFSAKIIGMYSETLDQRANAVNTKSLLPALTGGNPFNATAIQLTNAGYNEQQDRSKGIQFTLLHQRDFTLWGLAGRSQTALGAEFSHQGPAFASSGYDTKYYQADANWDVVINPALTTDYGRIPMPAQYWTVQCGIPTEPLFNPYAGRVTVGGVNYVAQHRILYDSGRSTAGNPPGLIPNAPTAANPNGFSGNWNPGGDTSNRLLYLANVTDWSDGRVTTVAGVSVNTFDTVNFGPTSTGPHFTILPKHDYWGYTVGANMAMPRLSGLRAYVTVSTAGFPGGTTRDYYGQSLKVPEARSPQPEIGLKWNSPDGRFIAQLSYDPATLVRNETQNAGLDYFNAVNPAGINGRHNGGDQWINLDREASAAGLVITAVPTRSWRVRFSATKL